MITVVMWTLYLLVRCRSSAFTEHIFLRFPMIHWEKKLLKLVKYKEMLLQNMSQICHILYQKKRLVTKVCECISK